jgi:hypothetical protein
MVAHTCNPSTQRLVQEDHEFKPAWAKKFVRPHLNNNKKVGCGSTCLPSQLTVGNINRRIAVQAELDKKQDPISKITRAKRAGGVAQVV